MNTERIQELAYEAEDYADTMVDGGSEFHPVFVNKFAELIVKECLGDFKDRIAKRYQGSDRDRDVAYGMEIVYSNIRDKFGVNE